ncbi:MAG: hypothetical protein ACI8W7_004618 [Gammaproteobacteria bacterium]|jgi:hypothetical protein
MRPRWPAARLIVSQLATSFSMLAREGQASCLPRHGQLVYPNYWKGHCTNRLHLHAQSQSGSKLKPGQKMRKSSADQIVVNRRFDAVSAQISHRGQRKRMTSARFFDGFHAQARIECATPEPNPDRVDAIAVASYAMEANPYVRWHT